MHPRDDLLKRGALEFLEVGPLESEEQRGN